MPLFQSLWIGHALSPLEAACIQSFLSLGHRFRLFAYSPIANVPQGCECADAREILPESAVFAYPRGPEQGMYAGFADLFRYKLLLERGGWWVDTDVVCLRREVDERAVGLAREDPAKVNTAIMRFPPGHEAMRLAFEHATAAGRDIAWGDTGPPLLTGIVERLGLEAELSPTHDYYPVHWSQYVTVLVPERRSWVEERVRGATFLHLWNELLRRAGLDKRVRPPRGCYLDDLYAAHGVLGQFQFEYLLLASAEGTLRLQRRALMSA